MATQTPPESKDPAAIPELESSVRGLSISEKGPVQDIPRPAVKMTSAKPQPKKAPVADSWEDEADSSESEDDSRKCDNNDLPLSPSRTIAAEGPLDPPPTPISPQTSHPWLTAGTPEYGSSSPARASHSRSPASRRPEKQTAVAGRLIAGALGIRAPKRTEEQRAYDRAVKEQEIKKRNREREEATKAKEEEERAKAAVWDE